MSKIDDKEFKDWTAPQRDPWSERRSQLRPLPSLQIGQALKPYFNAGFLDAGT